MSRKTYRWAPTTLIEPLVQAWPAWSYLLSPLTAALHAAGYQLPVLRSYLKDPDAHVAASRDPALFGGPWIDLPPECSGEVRRLLSDMETSRAEALAFGAAFLDLVRHLETVGVGQSLEPTYATLAAPLRGLVELVYDYHDHALVRIHEAVLYRSRYYDDSLQSLRLSMLADDRRPFFMSTPRCPSPGTVERQLPFANPVVDDLYSLDLRPRNLDWILERLDLDRTSGGRVMPLLTSDAVGQRARWTGPGMRVTYLGHACTLVEADGRCVLTDPVVPVWPSSGGTPRVSFQDLPASIDVAIVTHNHQDHFSLETLLRLRSRIDCLVVPKSAGVLYGDVSLGLLARRHGFRNVVELDELGTIEWKNGSITAVPFHGEHGDLAHAKNGYVVRMGGRAVWFAADSDCLDPSLYANVREACGPIDALFIGTESVGGPLSWVNGPLFPSPPDQPKHATRRYHGCSARSALSMADAVGAGAIFVYALGLEPWMDHLLGLGMSPTAPQFIESEQLLALACERGLRAERLQGVRTMLIESSARPPSVALRPPAPALEFQL